MSDYGAGNTYGTYTYINNKILVGHGIGYQTKISIIGGIGAGFHIGS